jgi:sugar phosphate permease
MLSEAYPGLAPIYGIVASLMFSVAYSISNIFMSSISKKWNKRLMLAIGVFMFSASSVVAGLVNSLTVFALMRLIFGMFASAINVPIYQLIASNFPIEFRTTANAIENTGYYIGAGIASFMVLVIK